MTATDNLLFTVYGTNEVALEIATRLADAKDWTQVGSPLAWMDIAFDPLVLRLMQDYPRIIGLPFEEPDHRWKEDIPYGDDE